MPYPEGMDSKISKYIDLVERRIFELVILIRDAKAGKYYDSPLRELEERLTQNEAMLACLHAARDFGRPVTLIRTDFGVLGVGMKNRMYKSIYPYGHNLYGTDLVKQEIAQA